jgi:hypothetical protein
MKTRGEKYRETVVNARRLLQDVQLRDKNSRDILKYIYNFLQYLKIVVCLFDYFSRNPQRCSVEFYESDKQITSPLCSPAYTRWFKYDRDKL